MIRICVAMPYAKKAGLLAASRLPRFIGSLLPGAYSRGLTEAELSLVPSEMQKAINLSLVRLINRAHNPFALNKILVRGHDIYWPQMPANFAATKITVQSLLIHELAHVWQYATGRLTAFRYVTQPRNWRYRYEVRPDARLDDYAIEAQADLVQDWFRIRRGLPPSRYRGEPPTRGWIEDIVRLSPRM